jgi:hypothetical protein
VDTLDRLAKMVRLPEYIEAERQRLAGIRRAVDRERSAAEPKALVKYPVNREMYAHQTKAANMALLTFGIIPPEVV